MINFSEELKDTISKQEEKKVKETLEKMPRQVKAINSQARQLLQNNFNRSSPANLKTNKNLNFDKRAVE